MTQEQKQTIEEKYGVEYDLMVDKYYEVLRNAMEIKSATDYLATFCSKLKGFYSKDLNRHILIDLAKEYTIVGNSVKTEEEYKKDVRSFTATRLCEMFDIELKTYYFVFYDNREAYAKDFEMEESIRECHFMPYNHTYLTITLPETSDWNQKWDKEKEAVVWEETPVTSYMAAVRTFHSKYPVPVIRTGIDANVLLRVNCSEIIPQGQWEVSNSYSLFNTPPVEELGFPPFCPKGREKYYQKSTRKDNDATKSYGPGFDTVSAEGITKPLFESNIKKINERDKHEDKSGTEPYDYYPHVYEDRRKDAKYGTWCEATYQ